jgi:hypothetical protein
MDPLSVAEDHLEAVNIWPTSIILLMFVEDPSDRTVKEVAGFLYGNDVPINLAVEYFYWCNSAKAVYLDEKMHEWSYIWDRNPYNFHKAWYYSMRLKAMEWIHGRARNQEEQVKLVKEFGMKPAECKKLILR